jgi:hypothetical protein
MALHCFRTEEPGRASHPSPLSALFIRFIQMQHGSMVIQVRRRGKDSLNSYSLYNKTHDWHLMQVGFMDVAAAGIV